MKKIIYWINTNSGVIAFYPTLLIWFVVTCLIMDFTSNDIIKISFIICNTLLSFLLALRIDLWIHDFTYKILNRK